MVVTSITITLYVAFLGVLSYINNRNKGCPAATHELLLIMTQLIPILIL